MPFCRRTRRAVVPAVAGFFFLAIPAVSQQKPAIGIDFLVACGTTGETPTLNEEECLRVVRSVAEAAGGRVPVWAGCTHNATAEAVAKAKAARVSRRVPLCASR